MHKRRRVTVVAGTAALLFGAGASFGAGTAAAAPLIGVCGGSVQGAPGTPVAIQVGPVDLIQVGEVPQSGSATFSVPPPPLVGGPACTVTATALRPVQEAVEQLQGATAPIVERIVPQAPPPAAPPPEQGPAPAQPQPGANGGPAAQQGAPGAPAGAPVAAQRFGPFLPAGFAADLPRPTSDPVLGAAGFYDYSKLFSATPGLFSTPGSGELFGYSPSFGILGAQDGAGAAQDVAAAGRAQALPTTGSDRVALPVLAAVLMLSAVTAALVRSWVHGARS